MATPVSLSPRQAQVARLVNDGFTYTEIGEQLRISPRTVESHAVKIRQKLGEKSTRRAASRARVRALVPRSTG